MTYTSKPEIRLPVEVAISNAEVTETYFSFSYLVELKGRRIAEGFYKEDINCPKDRVKDLREFVEEAHAAEIAADIASKVLFENLNEFFKED